MKDKFKHAFMDVAERFALLSTARILKVGCIIVKDDRIISIGYNGMPSGWSNECEDEIGFELNQHEPVLKTKPEVLHAEANTISKVARSTESCDGASMFVTHTPCLDCAKLIHQSGIKEVYYRNTYTSKSRGSGELFLTLSNISIAKLEK